MMLLMMFIFFLLGQLLGGLSGSGPSFNGNGHFFAWRTLIAAAMMSVPVVFFTLVFRHFDRQSLFYHRVSTIARARTWFGPRWHSFCHPADEAVQGLHSLPDAKLRLFDRGFATQRLTLLSVAVLPLAYLVMLASPNLMLGVADVLKTSVYDVDKYASVAKSYDDERQRIRTTVSQATANVPAPAGTPPQAVAYVEARRLREVLKQRYPNYVGIERALRFKSEFLENDGKPCLDGKLCGGGRDFGVNSRLLYHVVTDDVTSALINDDTRFGIYGEAIRVAIPIVVVPAVFVSTALLAMLVIGWFSRFASAALAAILNRMTLAEIKREIYGNDTGTEVAYGAEPRPAWLQQGRPYLPPGLADLLTLRANAATIASISKFRNAISNIALSVGQPPYGGVVSNYLTWKELIHSSYLDYPEFQSLVACQMSTAEGFAPTPGFAADPSFMDAKATLDAMARSAPILSAGKLPSPLSPVSP